MTREIANWFHEREGELFTADETPFDRDELVQVIDDSVDPVQQIAVDESRYYGVIAYDEHDGWYEYTRWDDMAGELPIGVCAKCIKDANSADKVARTLGDATDEARAKFEQHYAEDHAVDRDSVAVKTGATLLSGTTIAGNQALHPGMDGAGSGVDADFVQGGSPVEKGQAVGGKFVAPTDDIQTQFSSPGSSPTGTDFDSSDSIWNTDEDAGSIWKLDQTGSILSQFNSPSNDPQGIGVDQSDSIWNADAGADSIYQLDQSGSVLSGFSSPSTTPRGVGLDSNDSIWNTDSFVDSIYKLNESGSTLSKFESPSGIPRGIDFDSSDSIWHADFYIGICKLDQSGSILSQFESPSSNPRGIGLDSSESIWNDDSDAGSIYKFAQKGFLQL